MDSGNFDDRRAGARRRRVPAAPVPVALDRVGRRSDFAVLRSVVDGAVDGSGGSVFLEGEAGIGKTRLIDELLDATDPDDVIAVVGTQDPIGVNRPFGVLVDALADHASSLPWTRPEATDDVGVLYESIVDVVQRGSASSPVVLVVENLHWADDDTIQALCRLVRIAPQLALAVIVTSRPLGSDDRLHHLSRVVTTSGGVHHHLAPLSADHVAALAADRLGATPQGALVERLAAAGGNPLYALEILHGFEEHGVLAFEDGTVDLGRDVRPPPIGLTILRRLSILPPHVLEIVRAASILGRTFTVSDLGLTLDRTTEEVLGAVEEAITASVLAATATRLRFRHDVVWELLYEDLPAPVRATRHLGVARALAAAGRPPEDVVDHLLLGLRADGPDGLDLAASTARALLVGSPVVALKVTESALAAAGARDDTVELRVLRALALLATGDHVRGRDECQTLLASGVGPPLRGRLRDGLLASLTMTGRLDQAVEVCESALASTALDDAERANVVASLAFAKLHAGDLDESIDLAEFAAASTPAFEPATAARAHTVKAHALSHLGRFTECVDVALEAVTELQERGSDVLHFAHAIAGSRMMTLDRFDEGHDVLERGRLLYERHGSTAALCQYHVSKGFGHFVHGDWDDAIAEFLATEDLGDDGLAWPVLSHGALAVIAAERGLADEARRHLDVVDGVLGSGGPPLRADLSHHARAVLAQIAPEDAPDLERVARHARSGWDALTAGTPLISALGFTPHITHDLVRSGDADTAAAVADTLAECAVLNPTAPSVVGAALLAEGIVTDDVEPMLRSLDVYGRSGHVLARTFACRITADALIDAGRADVARPHLDVARQLCDSIGAVVEAQLVDAVAAKVGAASPPPTRRAVTGWDALTTTESTVVDYLGQRLSNPEIAEAMHISRRTVESHVSSILAKLGVRSRIDVAKLMADRVTSD